MIFASNKNGAYMKPIISHLEKRIQIDNFGNAIISKFVYNNPKCITLSLILNNLLIMWLLYRMMIYNIVAQTEVIYRKMDHWFMNLWN